MIEKHTPVAIIEHVELISRIIDLVYLDLDSYLSLRKPMDRPPMALQNSETIESVTANSFRLH